jgi:hypothetical protein
MRMTNVPAKALSDPVITIAPTFTSSSAFFNASFNSTTKAEFRAFNAFGRFNVMSSTPGSGLEINKFSYWLALVAMVRTVKLSREREETEESRGLDITEETRSGAFKSENEDLRDMFPDQSFEFSSVVRRNSEGKRDFKVLDAHSGPGSDPTETRGVTDAIKANEKKSPVSL